MSSSESEFYGLLRGAAVGLQLRAVMAELSHRMPVRCLTDSSGARGIIKRSGSGRVKHLDTRWLWLQERYRKKEVAVGASTRR